TGGPVRMLPGSGDLISQCRLGRARISYCVKDLSAHLQRLELRAREAAFHQGVGGPYIYIVRSGLLKQLYVSVDGSEWIKSFTGPGDLFACPNAIGGKAPTSFASVAIEASVVERIEFRILEGVGESSASAPQWIDRVPQRDLAGYLGVTAVGL